MRKIANGAVLVFLGCLALVAVLAVTTTRWLLLDLPLGDFRGLTLVFTTLVLIYGYAIVIYRLVLAAVPLREGEIAAGSRDELVTHLYFLFYIVLFNSLIRTHFIPAPLLRYVYLGLGARLGAGAYCVGVILDPPLTQVGNNSIIGHDAVLFSHAIEGNRLALGRIHIGHGVTIGAKAVIMSDVVIGDGAIVSAGAVVGKGARIGRGEIWGGVPAKRIRDGIDNG